MNPQLYYLHIPKAAGTTLHRVIDRQYPREAVYTIDGTDPDASIQAFTALSVEQRDNIQCLKGQDVCALHEFVFEV